MKAINDEENQSGNMKAFVKYKIWNITQTGGTGVSCGVVSEVCGVGVGWGLKQENIMFKNNRKEKKE